MPEANPVQPRRRSSRQARGQPPTRRPWWFAPAALTRPFLEAVAQKRRGADDTDIALRIEVQVLYATLAGLSALMYAYAHWQGGSPLTALFVLLACGNAVLLVALRLTGNLRAVAHATLVLALVTIALSTYWTGGLRGTNVTAFFITVVAAIFLLGWEGLGWAALSLVIPLGFQVAGDRGFVFPDLVPAEDRPTDAFMTWVVALVVVTAFVLYYEAARRHSLRMREKAEEDRSRFLANVSHELRNPLHAIVGMTDVALREELPAQARHALETASQNADALMLLIDDLLLLASMERSHFALEHHDFDPVGEVEKVASIIRLRCDEQQLDFRLSVAPGTPRWVRGDANRIRQVLVNLAVNAVKFTERGSVTLSIAPAEVADGRLGVRFEVADTGLGIRPEDRERIFERFVQADPSPTRAKRGAGLGLHIAREIVAAMEGRIELRSEPGEGSTFAVVVPFSPATGAPPEPAPSDERETSSARPLRVLVVDDDALNVRMAAAMLEELGHDVVSARDGQQAIDRWKDEHPDLILMDIQMPVVDGEQATRQIRAIERELGAPPVTIVAVTGHGSPREREQYLEAGASGCLFKPFRVEDLEQAISAALPPDAHAR